MKKINQQPRERERRQFAVTPINGKWRDATIVTLTVYKGQEFTQQMAVSAAWVAADTNQGVKVMCNDNGASNWHYELNGKTYRRVYWSMKK
jgi:hypothetical protein